MKCGVDLTKCSLYTTGFPDLECTDIILQAGIKVVVHGEEIPETMKIPEDVDNVKERIFEAKACFK